MDFEQRKDRQFGDYLCTDMNDTELFEVLTMLDEQAFLNKSERRIRKCLKKHFRQTHRGAGEVQ